ncbi:MAG: YbaB/EbfC family nucleoid-associated protein [Alphaproteobacteria bacterium]
MANLVQMMKQAQEMQGKMQQMQERVGQTEVVGQSGGGMVTLVMTGRSQVRKIKIDPKLVNPAEIEMLEDLIVAAANDAKTKADALVAGETEKMMGGLNLPPGFKLPF